MSWQPHGKRTHGMLRTTKSQLRVDLFSSTNFHAAFATNSTQQANSEVRELRTSVGQRLGCTVYVVAVGLRSLFLNSSDCFIVPALVIVECPFRVAPLEHRRHAGRNNDPLDSWSAAHLVRSWPKTQDLSAHTHIVVHSSRHPWCP
jgi:hypothetical protein